MRYTAEDLCVQDPNYSGFVSPLSKRILWIALLAVATLPGCAKRPFNKSFSSANRTGQFIRANTDLPSARPLDAGQAFRIGNGYDKLSGERRPSCLEQNFQLMGRSLNTTASEFSVISTKEELARKLNIEVNAEASGSYGLASGSVSSKTQILKDATFSEESVLGIMNFSYRSEELAIETGREKLSADAMKLLQKDPKAFRLQCGDAYSRTVVTGASVYVVIDLKTKSSATHQGIGSANSIKAKLPMAFGVDVSASVRKDQENLLKDYQIKVNCHSVGVDASACGQSMVVDGANLKPLLDYVDKVKTQFAKLASADSSKFVGMDELLEEYPKPDSLSDRKRSELFFDYAPQASHVRDLLEREAQINLICSMKSFKSCIDVRTLLANQIRYCARQQSWVDCNSDLSPLDKLLAEAAASKEAEPTIGKVTFWEHAGSAGKTMVVDFDRPADDPHGFRPDMVYNLKDFSFEDIASTYQSSLKSGWQLRIFEHPDGGGRCLMVGEASPQIFGFDWLNDKASSFRLERVGQYPTSC